MRKLIGICFVFIASLFTPLLAQENGYEIGFKIKGLKDSTRIQLAYYYGDKKLLQDSAFVANNQFTFKGDKALPRGLYIVVIPENGYFDMIIDHDQRFEMETALDDFIKHSTFKNHDENKDFYAYLAKTQPLNIEISEKTKQWVADSCMNSSDTDCDLLKDEIIKLKEEAKILKNTYSKKHPNYLSSKMFLAMEDVEVPMFTEISDEEERKNKRFNYYKEHYFDNIDFNETGLIRTPIFENRIDKYFNDLTQQSCDSVKKEADRIISYCKEYDMFRYLLNHITQKYEKSKIMCMDCMDLHMFQTYYLKDKRVDWIDSLKMKKIEEETWKLQHNQCGNKVYPLAMKDTNGVAHDIFDVDAEYTIVFFWSATCGHCKKTMPKLQKMYNRLHEAYDVEVYAIHIDKNRKEYDKFVQKYQFDWVSTVYDGTDNTYRTAYNVFSTPTVYLLNNNKEIIAKKIDITTIEKIITGKTSHSEDPLDDSEHDHTDVHKKN